MYRCLVYKWIESIYGIHNDNYNFLRVDLKIFEYKDKHSILASQSIDEVASKSIETYAWPPSSS